MSVLTLESNAELAVCDLINFIYSKALDGDTESQELLTFLYNDNWETIQERMETEGSVWYVWYMSGAYAFIQLINQREN